MVEDLVVRRFLTVRAARCPSFSYDGKRLFFISDISGVPQVWKWESGRLDQVTPFDERVSKVLCCPARDVVAFSMDTGGNERFQVYLLYDNAAGMVTDGSSINYLGAWSSDGRFLAYTSNARDVRFFDVYVYDAERKVSEVWMQSETICTVEAWIPGTDALVVSWMNTSLDNDLFLVKRGEAKLLTKHEEEAYFKSPRPDPEGRGLYLATNLGREFAGLAYLDLESGEIKYLYEPSWDVELVEVSPRGTVAFTVNVEGWSELYIYRPGSKPFKVNLPKGWITGMCWSPNGRLAVALSTPTHPSNIYLVEGGAWRRATYMPMMGLREEHLTAPTLMRYKSFDGLSIPVLVYKPKKGRPPYPAVVWVHGGPEWQERYAFNPLIQLLTYKGFLVLAPNVRGSTGYGKKYTHMDDVEKRIDALRDIEQLAKWAVEKGLARPGLGIMGVSYGGYATLACLAFFPKLWAAGVDVVGIANLITFLKNTGPWRRRMRETEYGSLETDLEILRDLSPINYVDRIEAPLLVIHGRNDPRVPVSEAEQIVNALKSRGKVVEAIIFEDEGHGISKLHNRVRAYSAVVKFFEKYVASRAEN